MAAEAPAGPPPTIKCESVLAVDFFGIALKRAAIDLGENLIEAHPALAERLSIEKDRRHRQDLARLDLRLE